jgi:hypothetical protein
MNFGLGIENDWDMKEPADPPAGAPQGEGKAGYFTSHSVFAKSFAKYGFRPVVPGP